MSEMMIAPQLDMTALEQAAKQLVQSKYSTERNLVDALWLIATGAGLGIDPATSLRAIHVIKGKPVLSADLMSAVAMRHPACEYLIVRKMTAEVCEIATKRRGWPEEVVMSWTSEDAKRAGLSGDNWKKYPQAMLKARCLGQIVRAAYPDALMGCYVEGEIEDAAQEPARATVVQAAPPAPLQLEGDVVDVTPEVDEVGRWRDLMGECGLSGDALPAASAACAQGFGLASVRDLPTAKLGKVNDKLAGMTPDARREYMNDKIAGLEGQAA